MFVITNTLPFGYKTRKAWKSYHNECAGYIMIDKENMYNIGLILLMN